MDPDDDKENFDELFDSYENLCVEDVIYSVQGADAFNKDFLLALKSYPRIVDEPNAHETSPGDGSSSSSDGSFSDSSDSSPSSSRSG